MGMNSRKIKNRAIEFEEEYNERMIEELMEQISTYVDGIDPISVSSELIEEIVVEWQDRLPDVSDWCFMMVENELADTGDAKYQSFKDDGII